MAGFFSPLREPGAGFLVFPEGLAVRITMAESAQLTAIEHRPIERAASQVRRAHCEAEDAG